MKDNGTLDWFENDPGQELNAIKLERISSGKELCDLSMINPDIDPPRFLVDKLLEATCKIKNHRYAVSRGVRKLREAFAEKYHRRFGVNLDPEAEVCAVMGTKDALVHAFTALTVPGDTLLIGAPTYPLYISAARLAGLRCEFFPIEQDQEKMLRSIAERLSATPTKVLVLNFPNNPTGAIVDLEFYRKLYSLVEPRGVFVLNDFVYGEMGYGDVKPTSLLTLPEFRECAAETYSMSKAYSVPGWRVGALVGQRALVRRLAKLKAHIDYGLFLPLQHAAAAGLSSGADLVSDSLRRYERRANSICRGLGRLGWEVSAPRGGVCVWSKIPAPFVAAGSREFAKRLVENAGVLVTPGALYGSAFDAFVRFALVQPEERIVHALSRLEEHGYSHSGARHLQPANTALAPGLS